MGSVNPETSQNQGNTLPGQTVDINLDDYFRRINYTGDRKPTLETLNQIHQLHPQAIPFENLNPLLRLPVLLDIPSLAEKLVYQNRGGYCFEQNLFLGHVLKLLGFNVKGLAARVLWNIPSGVNIPRAHMLLLLQIDNESYIADVGFGGLTLTSPLRLIPHQEQTTPHEVFRIIPTEQEFILEGNIREEWKPIYRFSLQEQLLPDYEVSSWYLANHPESNFIKLLIAARTTPECRYALLNNNLATHYVNGPTERQVIPNAAALRQTLEETFKINLPNVPELEPTLERLTRPQ